uniref:Uncharacterized protein n=1 Tax=Rhizophora mucronata TaxID=61149 RepID=A0A2P2QEH0_RHIMU
MGVPLVLLRFVIFDREGISVSEQHLRVVLFERRWAWEPSSAVGEVLWLAVPLFGK